MKAIKSIFQQIQNYSIMMYRLQVMHKTVAWYPNTGLQILPKNYNFHIFLEP